MGAGISDCLLALRDPGLVQEDLITIFTLFTAIVSG